MTSLSTLLGRGIPLRPALRVLILLGLAGASPAVAQDGFVDTDGARLYYRTIGQGEPILVVHGGPGMEHSYLLPGLDVLADRYRLVFYDQRGTGRSEGALDSTTISFDRFIADIEALRRDLGLERMTLLAHSWGGLLATSYALRFPDRLHALVLVNSVEPGSRFQQAAGAAQAARRTEADAAAIAELAGSEGFRNREAGTMNAIYRVAFRSTFADTARVRDLVIDFSDRTAKNGSDVARLVMTPMQGLDLWPRLRDLQVPTLVLHGEADVMPTDMAAEMADSIPGGTLALIPDAGHFPWIEQSAAFAAAVTRFLDRLDKGGAQ